MTDPVRSAEYIVRDGPATGALVHFVPPLFEEANRLRRTVRLAMRALADRGIGSALADLPGQNESPIATEDATLTLWRGTLADTLADARARATRPVVTAAIRGGALIDDVPAAAHWRLAPVTGASLLKTMLRTRIAADREERRETTIAALEARATSEPLTLAGNRLSPTMIAELRAAVPADVEPCRTVMLGEGIGRLPGRPLWLRAEPGEDIALAEAIAADIADWIASCGIS